MTERSAVAHLLDREVPVDSVRQWTDILRAEQKKVETGFHSILIFRIASELLGLATTAIEEVTEVGIIRRLPHRLGTLVLGIGSLRGEVLVCVSLDALLGLEKRHTEVSEDSRVVNRLVVCKTESGRFAFVAREVLGVERYRLGDLRPLPTTMAKSSNIYTAGILLWNNRQTIGILDAARLYRGIDRGLS